MSRSTAQFITRMKLRELARQRDRLREAYARIVGDGSARGETREHLRQLYDGLNALRVAGRRLHPEVANLEPLLSESSAEGFPAETATGWVERLERELVRGQLSSEFVYLFGALLEEWGRDADTDEAEGQRQAREEMTAYLLTAPDPPALAVLAATLDGLEPQLSAQARRAPELLNEWSDRGTESLYTLLTGIAANPCCPPLLCGEARTYAASALLSVELSDALSIFRGDISEWDWSETGVATVAKWAQNRWRLYLEEFLPDRCILESLGLQAADVFRQIIVDYGTLANRRARLEKIESLRAPESIVEYERELMRHAEGAVLLDSSAPNLWGRESGEAGDKTEAESYSILSVRMTELEKVRTGSGFAGDAYSLSGMVNHYRVVPLIHAEIQTARAAFPDRPLTVVKADIREFYASLPHDALLTILERFGIPEAERAFVRRFLTPPLRHNGTVERARRGVPMNHPLSHLLADLLLRLMERHIGAGARVRIIRQVDDICLLTPYPDDAVTAWERLQEFCADCGLAVNPEKSGAVCVGGTLSDGLPTAAPRWGLLALQSDGEWDVDESAIAGYMDLSRARWQDAPALLGKVLAYNEAARYLLRSLAPDANLGERHRRALSEAVRRFHRAFFGPGDGVAETLRAQIAERFSVEGVIIPEGWLYWPLTAGGLGLLNPILLAEQYAAAYRKVEPVAAPESRDPDWERERNDWSLFYREFLRPVEPKGPETTPQAAAQERDFIARGKEISAGAQAGLTPYWRWVLRLYGPEILDRFGTFGFLITELVPLALIRQQRGLDETMVGESVDEDGDEGEDPFAE